MFKKLDLQQKFELTVKQEIKNYNDSLNYILQSIRELNEKLDKQKSELTSKTSDLHQEIKNIESKTVNLKIHDECLEKKLCDFKYHSENLNKIYMDSVKSTYIFIQNSISEMENCKSKVFEFWNDIKKVKEDIEELKKYFNQCLGDMKHKVDCCLKSFKEEIYNKPSDMLEIKKHLEEKINTNKIDSDGIFKEMKVLKKENYINKKKIENIYTIIERLRGVN